MEKAEETQTVGKEVKNDMKEDRAKIIETDDNDTYLVEINNLDTLTYLYKVNLSQLSLIQHLAANNIIDYSVIDTDITDISKE